MVKIYETERLLLKILDKSSTDAVLDFYKRNKEFFQEWEPIRDEEFYTKNYQKDLLLEEYENIHKGKTLRLWLFKKDEDKNIIGSVCFSNIVRGCFQSCHLGYKMDLKEINQGYITEAIRKGIEIIFDDYGLHRIEANIMPKNVRSLRVVEKLGFTNEGLSRQYLKINGKWEDHVHMVLLNDNDEI
jgi:[ribosomal protein S5]-alanine N-acetyltransferase